MPALPEIEVLKRDLEREVAGRRFKGVEVRPSRNAMKVLRRHARRKDFQDLLAGAKVESIARAGKRLLLKLDNGHTLTVYLGRDGRLLKMSASDEVAPHTHIVFSWTIGGQLRVVDGSLTAEVFAVPDEELASLTEMNTSALDPLDSNNPPTWLHFSALLSDRGRELKALLVDESFVIGLGDIYSDEVLFAAALRHDRRSDRLSSQDVRRLYRGMFETLQDSVRAHGTHLDERPFTDLQGQPGSFQDELKVFGREGLACRRCRHDIEKTQWNEMTVYFCPQCQA